MNIKIGDTVRFISEKLEGKVTSLIDASTVNVYCKEYGFEIPASVNDLVVIRSDFATASSSGTSTHTQTQISVQSSDTVYLAIVPGNYQDLLHSRYEFFIVNDTSQTCLYSVAFRQGEKYTGITAGNCTSDQSVSLGSYTLKDIDTAIKAVALQVIFFQKGIASRREVIDTEVRLNSVTLCKAGSYKQNRWFSSPAVMRPLSKENPLPEEIDEKEIEQAIKDKKDTLPASAPRPQKQVVGNTVEIDLHSDELLETTAGMEGKDILEYQLDVFRKTLEEYKLRKGQKIVFIHGKGDGVLRQRILWELQTRYKRYHHQDASFKQYGYGATLVTIR